MTEFNPGGAVDLNHAVKLRYEANADTNAFTDAEKAKLAALIPMQAPFHRIVQVPGAFLTQGAPFLATGSGNTGGGNALAFGVQTPVSVDRIGLHLNAAAAAGSLAKAFIYEWTEADTLTLRLETPGIPLDASGYRAASSSFTFEAGRIYFVGARISPATVNTRNLTQEKGLVSFGSNSTFGLASGVVRLTTPFAEPLPATTTLFDKVYYNPTIAVVMRMA